MNNKRIALITAVLLSAMVYSVQDGVLLRRQLAPDSVEIYKTTIETRQRVDLPGMGEQEITINGSMTQMLKFGKIDAETKQAEVEVTSKEIKMEMGGLAAMASGMMGEMPSEMTFSARIDERNRFHGVKYDRQAAQALRAAGMTPESAMQFIEFPEAAVKVGDSWDVTLPANPMYGGKEVKVKARVEAEREHEGMQVYMLRMTGKFPMSMDASQMAGDAGMGMKMMVTGTVDMNSMALVDKRNGRTVLMESVMKTDTKTNIEEMGMSFNSVGETKMRMALQK
jgi:hypothetical protein